MKKLFVLCLSLLFITKVGATNVIDFNRKGSLSINLIEAENNEKVSGAEIELIKVASAKLDNNSNLSYELDKNLNCKINLTNLEDEELLSKVEECIDNNQVIGQKNITNANGIVNFNNLDLGLYLVRQSNELENYSSIDSYLITIPTIIDNNWIYDLNSEPKVEIIKLVDITINKVWNTTRDIKNNVTVELLLDDEVIDTIELSEDNNWTYTLNRMRLSDKYSVREINVPKDIKVTYKNEGFNFTVINTDTLPQTGQAMYLVPLLFVIGVVLVALGYTFKKSK